MFAIMNARIELYVTRLPIAFMHSRNNGTMIQIGTGYSLFIL